LTIKVTYEQFRLLETGKNVQVVIPQLSSLAFGGDVVQTWSMDAEA
jgi:hypothetical protein